MPILYIAIWFSVFILFLILSENQIHKNLKDQSFPSVISTGKYDIRTDFKKIKIKKKTKTEMKRLLMWVILHVFKKYNWNIFFCLNLEIKQLLSINFPCTYIRPVFH